MADPCVVSIADAGKKFCAVLPHSMYYGIRDVCRSMIGLSSAPSVLRPHEFWAVDHVTFALKRGERLGLLGTNGSGGLVNGKLRVAPFTNGLHMGRR